MKKKKIKNKRKKLGVLVLPEVSCKGCGGCGRIDEKLGGKEVFKCKHCDYICDRDRGAARSIYLKCIESCVGVFSFDETMAVDVHMVDGSVSVA